MAVSQFEKIKLYLIQQITSSLSGIIFCCLLKTIHIFCSSIGYRPASDDTVTIKNNNNAFLSFPFPPRLLVFL